VLTQRLERAQEHRQALSLDRLPDEDQPQRRVGIARHFGQLGRHLDPVRDDAVLAAVEAPAGPRSGLGNGDAHMKVVELALGPEHEVGEEAVAERVLGVAVEGADQRRARGVERVVADPRRVRLVDVDDVEVAGPQLAAQSGDRVGRQREVRDRAVGLDPDGAA
jgi:hypothetical protein